MEAVIVGGLTAAAAVTAVLLWQLLVHPEAVLAMWSSSEREDGWFEHHPAAVGALRTAAAALVFLLAALAGMALTFLQGTG